MSFLPYPAHLSSFHFWPRMQCLLWLAHSLFPLFRFKGNRCSLANTPAGAHLCAKNMEIPKSGPGAYGLDHSPARSRLRLLCGDYKAGLEAHPSWSTSSWSNVSSFLAALG